MFSAKIIAENNHPEDAVRKLEKIDTMLINKYYIKFYLGSSHLALNHLEMALTYFTHALELHPTKQDAASIYTYMGICYKEMEKYRQAIEALERAETYDSERTDIYNLMGFSYFMLKEHEKAIACFKKVLKLDPSSAIDYANIASNYRDMGINEKAVEYYEMALALDPSIEFARDSLDKIKSSNDFI